MNTSLLDKAARYAHTIQHLNRRQVLGRIGAPLRRQFALVRLSVPGSLSGALHPAFPFPHHDPWNSSDALCQGIFTFLNYTEQLGRPVNWSPQGVPILWQFNLHYFNYLHLLERADQEQLCREWIAANPPGSAVGWHPYPTSLRIINWCKAGFAMQDVLASLYTQAAYLCRNVETYLEGNHVLENARALVFAGSFFSGENDAKRWLERGLALYREESRKQILDDGGHFERSPMYHALMLEGYLDVLNLLPENHPDRPMLTQVARKMCGFAASMIHPDGSLALLNDATQEIALPASKLLQYEQVLLDSMCMRSHSFPDTGYYVHTSKTFFLIADGGPVGPDHFPAHAHADMLTYELSIGGNRLVVDSGVFDYEASEMRAYCRSTRAHNTVCIDDTDQVECWGGFRVARRYSPRDVSFHADGRAGTFRGTYGGYAQLIGDEIEHRRTIMCSEQQGEVSVVDEISGTGTHRVVSHIHFHPDVQMEATPGGLLFTCGSRQVKLETTAPVRVEKGWYCPEFGMRIHNTVIAIGGDCALPTRLEYAFVVSPASADR